jgi:hypothetical protein
MKTSFVGLLATILFAATLVSPLAAPAEAHGPRGSKQWCRHHQSKCRRWARSVQQKGRHVRVTVSDDQGEIVARRTYEAGGGAAELWKINGFPPDGTSKRGCARVSVASRAQAALPPRVTWYRLRVTKRWCWNRGKVIPKRRLEVHQGWPHVHWIYNVQRTNRTVNRHYAWKRGHRRSGHKTYVEGHAEACFPFAGCFTNRYPYVRLYAHSDGSWHASGHDW